MVRDVDNKRLIREGWRKGELLAPKLSIGDLVEFQRAYYRHWGVFIGDHDGTPSIIHLSTNDGDFDGAGNSSKKCSSKILHGSTATVRIDPFLKVAKDDDVRVNHFDYSCPPLPPAKIKERAFEKLGTGEYHLINSNCEHFAKWCRYGDEARQRKNKDERNQSGSGGYNRPCCTCEQCAATIATTANIIPGTEQFEKVTEYFRETMLNELECKLQELHQRENKPWIIIYLTHIDPDYGTQEQLTTLTLNESPSFARRFFELITRYKIDLIASCGNFGMPEMFKQHAIDFPSDPLPKYFRVSFSGYGFGASVCSENDEGENNEGGDGFFDECNYVVLDVTKDATLFYYKKRPSGKILESGTIYKNTQEPEKCVEKEL
ncbi:lecithin retinol acyltransferase domain-containing protein [Ditylenchus destructor]|uniref:Lecithin retinol acyltransferase domain-containing protein n=1 Tax=Ditylenchus destructor TaxID=166010 RepID=A0AAD4MSE4_9BILA|nr:lecithin retinol acyltransferase domain-containing protein [Ditylenchus destructor]